VITLPVTLTLRLLHAVPASISTTSKRTLGLEQEGLQEKVARVFLRVLFGLFSAGMPLKALSPEMGVGNIPSRNRP
jgi:hypothetical protein